MDIAALYHSTTSTYSQNIDTEIPIIEKHRQTLRMPE